MRRQSTSNEAGKSSPKSRARESRLMPQSESDSDSSDSDNDTFGSTRNVSGSQRLSPRRSAGAGSSFTKNVGSVSSSNADSKVASLRSDKDALMRTHSAEIAEIKAAARKHGEDDVITSLKKEVEDLKNKAHTSEKMRLQRENDLASKDLKASEDRAIAQSQFNKAMEDLRSKHDSANRELAESQSRSIADLKRLHIEEIASIRQRSADAKLLESLASQVKQSAATLKILENKMITSKMASEAGRESQLEARERLIGDMERSARESMERSESQAARLQGSVSSVEDVMRSLRNQNIEERERLKAEHTRLESMQSSLMAERAQFLSFNQEERSKIADRWAALEAEKRMMEEDLVIRREEIDRERATLARERSDFSRLQAEASRAAEAQVEEMAIEEKRLNEARSALMRDVGLFEQRQDAAKQDILTAENTRLELDGIRAKLDEDTAKFQAMGEELHKLGHDVHAKEAEAEQKMSEAERIRTEGINAQRTALAAKNSLDIERAKLAEERRRADDERVRVAHDKMSLLREQTSNRQLNLKLTSAASVGQTPGVQAAWGAAWMSNRMGGAGSYNPSKVAGVNQDVYNKEFLGSLRRQVDNLSGSGGGYGGERRENSEFLATEEKFMNSVRKMGVREGGGEEDHQLQLLDASPPAAPNN